MYSACPPRHGPHCHVSIRAAGKSRVDREAETRKPPLAVLAEAAADVERHHDPVAYGQCFHSGPDIFDYTHVLVSEDYARFGRSPTLIHVQVGAADATRSNLDDYVIRMLYLGIGNFLYGNAERTLVHDGSHDDLLFALLDC